MAEALSPTGCRIVAAYDLVPGNAQIMPESFERNADGSLTFEWDGETEMIWDGSETLEREGCSVYVDEDGDEWTEDQIRLEDEEAPPPVPRKPLRFEQALESMRRGFRVRPPGWRGCVALVDGQLTRISETGAQTPWQPHPVLILADGWTVVERQP